MYFVFRGFLIFFGWGFFLMMMMVIVRVKCLRWVEFVDDAPLLLEPRPLCALGIPDGAAFEPLIFKVGYFPKCSLDNVVFIHFIGCEMLAWIAWALML